MARHCCPTSQRRLEPAIFFEELGDTVIPAVMGPMFINRIIMPKFMGMDGDLAAADKAEKEDLPPLLDKLEALMPEDGGFLVEDRLTIADIALASPFVNLKHAGYELDAASHPKLTKWYSGIVSRDSYAAHIAAETKLIP